MTLVIAFIFGSLFGIVVYRLVIRFMNGHGYFLIEKFDEEDEAYIISVKVDNDPKITKRRCILLERDFGQHISQK